MTTKRKKALPSILNFSARREEIPVTIENEDGTTTDFILRELDGTMRDAYLTALGGRVKYDKAGKSVGLRDFSGIQAEMLTRSLFYASDGKPITVEVLNKWPSRIQEALFKQVKEMSGLDDEAEEDAKND